MAKQDSPPVKVRAPASSANLGPGFDVFAVALEEPADVLVLRAVESPALEIEIKAEGTGTVPTEPRRNAAGAVAMNIAKDFGIRSRISIVVRKGVPIGVGLGSSAASSSAAVFAMNERFRLGLHPQELVRYAAHGELVSSGAEHFDNVAASIMGGFTVAMAGSPLQVTHFGPPPSLRVCLVTPAVRLPDRKTEYARSLLPKTLSMKRLARNTAAASMVVAGFAKKDIAMIGRGMVDEVVEPARAAMNPGYARVREAALKSGAAGACISGAGPTVLALVDASKSEPSRVLEAMEEAFGEEGVKARGRSTTIGRGTRRVG